MSEIPMGAPGIPTAPGGPGGQPGPADEILVAFAEPAEQRRLTVLVRLILAIPHIVVLWVLGIAAEVVALICWFAALVTGHLPDARGATGAPGDERGARICGRRRREHGALRDRSDRHGTARRAGDRPRATLSGCALSPGGSTGSLSCSGSSWSSPRGSSAWSSATDSASWSCS